MGRSRAAARSALLAQLRRAPHHRRTASQTIGPARATISRSAQGEPDPRGAQHGQPRRAIAEVQQRTDQHDQIAHRGAILQRLDVHGPKCDAARAQAARDLARVCTGAHQNGDAPLGMLPAPRRDQIGDRQRFAPRRGEAVDGDRRARRPPRTANGRVARPKSDGAPIAIVRPRHDAGEAGVDPIHDGSRGAEIAAQALHVELHVADAVLGELEKCPDLRLAKSVNRLHGIADAEHAASVAALPAGREQPHQLELSARGVLKFVDQDVLQPIVEPQAQIGRARPRCRARAVPPSTPRENRPRPARERPAPTPPPRAPAPAPRRARAPSPRRCSRGSGSVRISTSARPVSGIALELGQQRPASTASRRIAGGKPSALVSRLRERRTVRSSTWPPCRASARCACGVRPQRALARSAIRRFPPARRRGAAPRRAATARGAAIRFAAQRVVGAAQRARDQQLEIFVEVPAHAPQLRFIERARGLQTAGEQRQPAIAARAASRRSTRPAGASADRRERAPARRRFRTSPRSSCAKARRAASSYSGSGVLEHRFSRAPAPAVMGS